MFSVRGLIRTGAKGVSALVLLAAPWIAWAQRSDLALADAIKLAAQRNGDLRAAIEQIRVAQAQTAQSRSSLYPSLTPFYQYTTSRSDTTFGGGVTTNRSSLNQTGLNASWTLLDNGQRDLGVRGASRSEESARQNARATIRNLLFSVQQQFFDALRAQALLRVNETQVQRSKVILDQTDKRIELRDAPRKDHLQANADYLNAKVAVLAQRNQVAASQASLVATLGLDESYGKLIEPELPSSPVRSVAIQPMVDEALKNRPELRARRSQVEAQLLSVQRARLGTLPGFTLTGDYNFAFNPAHRENGALTFTLSMPLFDGGFSRAQLAAAKAQLQVAKSQLLQDERSVRAETETAAQQLELDGERLEAAIAARTAAQENYRAAEAAQGAGAATVVDVLTAQVSLVTAESNYIQAIYDYMISAARLDLVTGRPLQGEELLGKLP